MRAGERYRRYAAECLKLAQEADAEADNILLREMAETWRALADRLQAPMRDPDGKDR